MIITVQALAFGKFFNTAIISYLVKINLFQNLWSKGSVISSINAIQYTNLVLPNFLYIIIDTDYFERLWIRYKIKKSVEKNGRSRYNQKQANALFEGFPVNPVPKYSKVLNTMLLVSFYAYIFPLGPVIGVLTLSIFYALDKYFMLTRQSKSVFMLSEELSGFLVENFFPFILLMYSLGVYLHSNDHSKRVGLQVSQFPEIQFYISLINFFFPIRKMVTFFFVSQNFNTKRFDDMKYKFESDYDRSNPKIKDLAIQHFMVVKQQLEFENTQQESPLATVQEIEYNTPNKKKKNNILNNSNLPINLNQMNTSQLQSSQFNNNMINSQLRKQHRQLQSQLKKQKILDDAKKFSL